MKVFKATLLFFLLSALLLTLTCAQAEGSWQAGDPAIASVSPDGTITGVAPGETTVTVTVDGLSVTIPVTVFESCPHCGGPLEEGNHNPVESRSSYCDVQHYACTGTGHYCDPNGENPGCGDTYPCGSSNAHTACSACGALWCSRSANAHGHTAPCGNRSHRPCVLTGYDPGEHAICGDCYEPLCNGDRHGTGRGRCSYFEPVAQPLQPPVQEPEEEYPEEDIEPEPSEEPSEEPSDENTTPDTTTPPETTTAPDTTTPETTPPDTTTPDPSVDPTPETT